MSKKHKTKVQKSKKTSPNVRHNQNVDQSKRGFLNMALNIGAGVVVVGGIGGFLAYSANATMHEQDLSRIGQGTPSVVQVHDPNCSLCRALQRETRDALESFADGELEYIVANITLPKGERFAHQHGVPHVTLLLFDGEGNLQNTLRGQQKSEFLKGEFAKLLQS